MQSVNNLSLVMTAIIAVGGWIVVHWLQQKREIARLKKEKVTDYLIDAYRILYAASHNKPGDGRNSKIEQAMVDIQLFGNSKQISIASKFALEFSKNGKADITLLLTDIRDSLRDELMLPPVSSKIFIFKMNSER